MILTPQRKRLIVLAAGLPLIFCLANYLSEWHFFGFYDKQALVISVVPVFVLFRWWRSDLFTDEASPELNDKEGEEAQ